MYGIIFIIIKISYFSSTLVISFIVELVLVKCNQETNILMELWLIVPCHFCVVEKCSNSRSRYHSRFVIPPWCTLMNFGRDYHCGLIGYHSNKIPRAPVTPQVSSHCMPLGMSKINSPAISGLEAALGRAEQSISKSQSISELGTF